MTELRELDEANVDRWDRFVRSSPEGTFYHLSGWRRLIGDVLGHSAHYVYTERAGEITGVLPLVRVRSMLFGDALISVPFLVYGGPIAADDESRRKLVAESMSIGQKLGVDYVELRNRAEIPHDEWTTRHHYVTFRKNLAAAPDDNLRAIPRKQRAMVRKGIKADLRAEVDQDVDRLYDAMLVCKRNLGTPFFSKQWLAAIKAEFGEAAEVLTVTHDSETVCSVMSFRYGNEILPYYGGGGDLARQYKGNDFMYWAVMEKACQEGVELFDYGRSQEGSGAYRFKKHWGFEPTPLAYQYYLVKGDSVPELNPSNPKYQFLITAWKRLPLPLAGLIGPLIARRLG